jgi:hypothetical protein
MPGSPQWFPSLRFPHQNPVRTSPLPHTRYAYFSTYDEKFQEVCEFKCYTPDLLKILPALNFVSLEGRAGKVQTSGLTVRHFTFLNRAM